MEQKPVNIEVIKDLLCIQYPLPACDVNTETFSHYIVGVNCMPFWTVIQAELTI